MFNITDTIAAIATPLGEGGISIIRLSGESSLSITDKIFSGRSTLSTAKTHTAHFGNIINTSGSILDEVVATVFISPNSYTGENIVEISCHGGVYITKNILQLVLNSGARMAEPGEFTKRAFINGKIDLLQAEAVSDIIHSRSELALKSSINQVKGNLSIKFTELRSKLLNLCSLLELELDFVEEGYEFADRKKIESDLEGAISQIKEMLQSFSIGRYYRDGIKIVITGKPNVGKSSLLNALLKKKRAIVTDIPGTTRDVIEDEIVIDGVTFRFIDTAGIRATTDIIEAEGVQRSYEQISMADVVLNVSDINEFVNGEDAKQLININSNTILVFNKIDLATKEKIIEIRTKFSKEENIIFISAKKEVGVADLVNSVLKKTIYSNGEFTNTMAITNIRHKLLLEKTLNAIDSALSTVFENRTSELITIDVRSALNYIGEITGEITSEEILNNVFSNFCIGK